MQRRKWTGSGISPSWEEVDSRRSSESREKRLGRHTKILCKRCLPGPRRGGPHPSPGLPSAAARSPGASSVQKGATRRDSLREARSLAGKSLRARLPLRQEKKASKWGYWATINEFNSKTDPRPPADSGFLHRSLQRLLYGGLDAVRRLQLRTRSSGVDEGVRKDLQGPRPA